MKRLLATAAVILALSCDAAAAPEDGTRLGLAIIIQLSETVCEIKLSPAVTEAKELLLNNVSKKEVIIGSSAVITSWDGKKDAMAKWCASATKTLRIIEEGMKP
ncbi:hypothetical protein JQ596_15675 [Bradyrhizobium manausense]|uniref:hypothetical protein n=1 Tax=Bradyrhizobium manausense TaxID=989370 RepID=UPI001BA837A8|nr:hypothetical protein [Bradyrhizobium manausense]MBR0826984.1 hypothetical protein [Bradyrhizobium manausense]